MSGVKADWVIVGERTADGVKITASVNEVDGEVQPMSAPVEFSEGGRRIQAWVPIGVDIRVSATHVVYVDAPTYAEALRLLGNVWSPERAREVEGG